MEKPEIFFSYAWGDEEEQGDSREKIVNELYESLLKDDYKVVRDKYDLGYKGFISDFMGRIGRGKCIVVAISKKYVRSPYCMFELYEIARNSNFDKQQFREKVLPMVVERVDFTKPAIIKEYLTYWKNEKKEWDMLIKSSGDQLSIEQLQRYDKIKMIQQNFGKLTDWIVDMNTLSPKILTKNDFAEIKKAIGTKVIAVPTDSNPSAIYGEKKIKKFLGGLPFFSETFIGREDDLRAVHKKLFGENNLLLLVNGEGGIGKTTLAATYYRTFQDDYQHLAWIFAEKSILDALLTLALPLMVSFKEGSPNEQRLEVLLDAMRNLQKPCLLVIDNANELKDLENYYYALRRCPNFHIILTTRITQFEEATIHKVERLERKPAIELFVKHYPKHQPDENEILEKIMVAVGYNTLVIEILAKNLRNVNQIQTQYSLSNLLKDLQERGLLGLSKTAYIATDFHSRGSLQRTTPEEIIAAMYDISSLDDEEKRMLSVFSVLPAENIPFETIQSLLPELELLDKTLVALAQKGWLEYAEGTSSFKMSPVIQEITKKKNPQLTQDCQSLLIGLIEKLDYEGGTGHLLNATYAEAAKYAWYSENVVSNYSQRNYNLTLLNNHLGNYYMTTGNLNKALTFYKEYSLLSQELYEAYPQDVSFKNGLAISYQCLGITQTALGNLNKALTFFEDFNSMEKELYEAYPQNVKFKNGLAASFQKLGNTQAELGNLDKALTFYEDFNRLEKELYESYPQNVDFKNGLAVSCQKLGNMQTALGYLDKALTFYEDYNRLEKELYEAYPQNVFFKNGLAISYAKLGETQVALGNLDKALTLYEAYNSLEKELYEAYSQNVSFKNGLAISYWKLGNFYRDRNDKTKAHSYFQSAMEHWEELTRSFPSYVEFSNNLREVKTDLEGL